MDRDKRRVDPDDDLPGVTNEAMSATPRPPDPRGGDAGREMSPAHDPEFHPAAAAREIPVTSGGQLTEPDLAELPDGSAPSEAASQFDVNPGAEAAEDS